MLPNNAQHYAHMNGHTQNQVFIANAKLMHDFGTRIASFFFGSHLCGMSPY